MQDLATEHHLRWRFSVSGENNIDSSVFKPVFALALFLLTPDIASAQKSVNFIKDVLPILKESCSQCHDAEDLKSGLDPL